MSTGWFYLEKVVKLISILATTIWISRYLGPEKYGLLSFALAIVAIFSPVAKLGISSFIPRELPKPETDLNEYLVNSVFMVFVGGLVTYLLLIMFLFQRGYPEETTMVVMVAGFLLFFLSNDIFEAYYYSQQKGKKYAQVSIIAVVFSLLLKFALIRYGADLYIIVISYLLDVAFLFLLFVIFVCNEGVSLNRRYISALKIEGIIKGSWPYIISGLSITVYMKIDLIMIREFLDEKSVGEYAVASRVSEGWYFLPMVFVAALYPLIVNAKLESQISYLKYMRGLYALMLVSSVGLSFVVFYYAEEVVNLLFGDEYLAATGVLKIHIWASVFVFVGVASSKWLLTEKLQKYSAINTSLGAVLNIILNFMLVPSFGIEGAAWSTLIAYSVSSYFSLLLWSDTRENFFLVSYSIFFIPALITSTYRSAMDNLKE